MEAALKEAVREGGRAAERAALGEKETDMEYLKNLVLRLLQTYDGESLLPVLSALLVFSPAEVQQCKDAIAGGRVSGGMGPGWRDWSCQALGCFAVVACC